MIDNKLPQSLTSSVAQEFQPIYDISLVIPTRNEEGNIEQLLMRIHQAVKGIATEVVFVDDSTDNTPQVIRKLQELFPLPIKLIHRPKELRKNGLGGAVVEGFQAAQAKWACVMDADLKHPPEMIPRLYRHAQKSRADIVMGSWLAPGGDASSLGFIRTILSYVFAWTTRLAFPQRLRQVTDPLTGFFMTRRAALNPERLRTDGFKILLEILVSHPHLKVTEVPIQFGSRNAGESKASIYVVAKLIWLFAMTILRYLLSNNWTWNKKNQQRPPVMKEERKAMMNAKIGTFDYSYNIHNIIKVASMCELPELEYFRVPALTAEPDILLRLERRRQKERRRTERSAVAPRRSTDNIHYGESLGRYGFEISISNKDRVNIAISPILRLSRHVLYTNVVEPILRWCFVRKGYALVHAACVSFDGQAVLVTGQTDTGKTSTILRTVDNYACSFLSDDMTIVSRDGRVMSYPKPLTISRHTLGAVNAKASLTWWERIALQFQSRLHSRSGRKVGLSLSKSKLPAATMNAIAQMLVPPPKYMVHRLIPRATYANFAILSRAVIIERGDEYVEALHHQQAVETFVRNAEDAYVFPPYPLLAQSLSQWNGQDLHPHEQAIVDEALKSIPTIRLRDPKFNWWQRLPVVTNLSMGTRQFAAADD